MPDLKPEIEKIFTARQKEFFPDEEFIRRFEGEEGIEEAKALQGQYWLMRAQILNGRDSIEGDEAEELREMIANKLAIGSNIAPETDWWWAEASPLAKGLLKEVHRVLEKGTAKKKRAWRWLRYAWNVFLELAYLAIVLSVFSVTSTRFETVVVALLVLIYNTIRGIGNVLGFTLSYIAASWQASYGELGRAMKLKVPVLPQRDAEEKLSEITIWVFIHGITLGLGSLIALYQILTTV